MTIASCLDWRRHPRTLRARLRADLVQQVRRGGLELSGEPEVAVEGVGDGVRVRISSAAQAVEPAPPADASTDGVTGGHRSGELLAQRAALAVEEARARTAQSWVTSVRSAGVRQHSELLYVESVATRLRVPELASGPVPRWVTAVDTEKDG